ncbi:TonB-dependent receptor [Parapedobacter sp. DT-150]|uniref:TonB-dependent receptor n=1 Tax=Parapedobacter sp. DT-150 TaxID=3396162 RepID=UPI003F1C7E08
MFETIEKQTDLMVVYNDRFVDPSIAVSISINNTPLNKALESLLKPVSLTYHITENTIVITKLPMQVSKETIRKANELQQRTVSGRVTDEKGNPLEGVTVSVKGSSSAVTTDGEGGYRIGIPDSGNILTFTIIGFEAIERPVGSQNTINIVMKTSVSDLDEVVVVGYGTQQKRDLTGAVAGVKMDVEMSSRPMVEFGQALYGKVPGVQVISANGRPGTSSTVQVRGINSISAGSSPLIVVDGMPLSSYDLNMVNSADIESIDILKDAASASIYGSRGANGVILVTTKKGKSGTPRVTVGYASSLQQVINKVDVMNAAEYAQAAIDAAQNGWIGSGGDPNAPNTVEARGQYKYTWPAAFEHPESLPSTDWQDVIFRTAPMQKVDLNVTGGNERTTYLLSGAFVDQEGIVITSAYKKYALNLKVNSNVTDWLEIGGGLNMNSDREREPFNRTVEWAVQYPSIYPVFGSDGYLGAPANTSGYENYDNILFRPINGHPFYRINDLIIHKRFNNLGNVFAQVTLLPELTFKSAFNYYYRRSDDRNYQAIDHYLGPDNYTEGIMTVRQDNVVNYTAQQLLNYDKHIGGHHVSGLLGFEFNKNEFYGTTQERRGYENDLTPSLSMGSTVFQALDNATETTLISYFGRVNYSFKSRYLLSASVRRDGSSRFAPQNKWGYFPSVSAGWVISDESFMLPVSFINHLKLRASFGYTGNDRFSDYLYLRAMNWERAAFGDNLDLSYYPANLANTDLAWERTQQVNVGLEGGFFDNRIALEADVYRSTSDGLLLNVPAPSIIGFTGVFQNIGKLENRGLELNLNTRNLIGEFSWSTQLNFSMNRSEVLELGRDGAPMVIDIGNGMQLLNRIGEPIYNFFAYEYLGVYQSQAEIDADPASYAGATPGDGKYRDVNGDGRITGDDRTIIGNSTPDFTYGFTNDFRYKQFDLSVLVQGVQGNEVFDVNFRRSKFYHEGRNYFAEVSNRWRSEDEPGDGYHYKLNVDLGPYNQAASSYWVADGSFLRVKSLTLGYTLRPSVLKRLHLTSLRIYFNGQNLFTEKKSPLFDPENFNGNITDATVRGVSHSPYPSSKTYTLGINIGL